jgi:O-antigen ligase
MARSRAGLALTIVALIGAFALGLADRRVSRGFTSNKILVGGTILGVILVVQYALYRILERFEVDPLDDERLAFVPTTIEAAKSFLPLGSGLGTFVPAYAPFERPQDALFIAYVNRAHNDAAELFLEAGVFGVALIVLFVSWLFWRSIAVWRTAPPAGAREVDWSLARAATIIIALILAHSLVDYPLRTGAIAALMAFCCALLIEPIAGTESVAQVAATPKMARHRRKPKLSPVPALSPIPSLATAEMPDHRPAPERWGSDIQWPEEWRKNPSAKQPS